MFHHSTVHLHTSWQAFKIQVTGMKILCIISKKCSLTCYFDVKSMLYSFITMNTACRLL